MNIKRNLPIAGLLFSTLALASGGSSPKACKTLGLVASFSNQISYAQKVGEQLNLALSTQGYATQAAVVDTTDNFYAKPDLFIEKFGKSAFDDSVVLVANVTPGTTTDLCLVQVLKQRHLKQDLVSMEDVFDQGGVCADVIQTLAKTLEPKLQNCQQ